jgi:hypothetical protein
MQIAACSKPENRRPAKGCESWLRVCLTLRPEEFPHRSLEHREPLDVTGALGLLKELLGRAGIDIHPKTIEDEFVVEAGHLPPALDHARGNFRRGDGAE